MIISLGEKLIVIAKKLELYWFLILNLNSMEISEAIGYM